VEYNQPQWNYDRHRADDLSSSDGQKLPACYSSPRSIDAWRHERMHRIIMPVLRAYPEATWMTIGDGSYGSDAYFLRRNGTDVLATSLSDASLAIAQQRGFIARFQAENAESISVPDESFDFVLCKESFHHFPRPAIAFYEMVRVAKRAVVLIEPQETSRKLLDHAKNVLKRILRKDKSTLFEPSGNFIFRLSARELEKMMTALNHEAVAIKRFNDFYHPRLANADYATFSFPALLTRLGIVTQNLLCALRMLDYGLACVVAFKGVPGEDLQHTLRRHGFRMRFLPRNPYLQPKGSTL
jgi:ubiquinone/menaquinone biosynthesis C-methylase UbiE